jgi:hypothetical protein
MTYVKKYLRTFVLGAGVVSSWSAVIVQFSQFYKLYGTFLHASTLYATNPFLTPCLYGSLAFLVACIWSCWLVLYPNARSEWWLNALLIFGIVFASVVMLYECGLYFGYFRFGPILVCTPGVNPLYTPCFRGLIFFFLAFAASWWQMRLRVEANI